MVASLGGIEVELAKYTVWIIASHAFGNPNLAIGEKTTIPD
jgi:hypothetical protein